MRLIDVDTVISVAEGEFSEEDVSKIRWLLSHIGTAYNIDKVVGELGTNGKCVAIDSTDCPVKYCWDCEENVISVKKAIEIVKRGGKDGEAD